MTCDPPLGKLRAPLCFLCLHCRDSVAEAMRLCPRDLFMPEGYADVAWVDTPVRIEELGFNISAPHIHVAALSHLDLKAGERLVARWPWRP